MMDVREGQGSKILHLCRHDFIFDMVFLYLVCCECFDNDV
jgi:hypothetical protein